MTLTAASWLLTIGMISFFVLYPPRPRHRAPRDPHAPPSIAMQVLGWSMMLMIIVGWWTHH